MLTLGTFSEKNCKTDSLHIHEVCLLSLTVNTWIYAGQGLTGTWWLIYVYSLMNNEQNEQCKSSGFDWESNKFSMWNFGFSSWLDNPWLAFNDKQLSLVVWPYCSRGRLNVLHFQHDVKFLSHMKCHECVCVDDVLIGLIYVHPELFICILNSVGLL